ncbi:MAG: hypothetical protein H6831_12705 [Planctomycetes bacterium]|nr:hypothetical protein [Planctomycetota bacterium]MCB9905260.1 hypothetical protein [Planctomycetota bacterium]
MPHRTTLTIGLALLTSALFAAPVPAQCGEQHELIPFPTGLRFGRSITATDTHVFVGGQNSPGIYVFDADSLIQLAIFNTPGIDSDFGRSIEADGNYLLVGSKGEYDPVTGLRGAAHLFDVSTYSLVGSFAPNYLGELVDFGITVAVHGNLAAVAGRDVQPGDDLGVVFVFSVSPMSQLVRIHGPNDTFGRQLAISDDYLCISSSNRVYIFDAANFASVGTVDLTPYPAGSTVIEIIEDRLYVGQGGKVLVFDVNTQAEIGRLIPSVDPLENGGYGRRIDASGATLANGRIAVTRPELGSTYVFDAQSLAPIRRFVSSYAARGPLSSQYEPVVAINSTRLFATDNDRVVVYDLDVPCELTTFCYGGGPAYAPCLCGNQSGADERAGCTNSTGLGSTLRATGSTSLSDDDLRLECAHGPVHRPGVFLQGASSFAIPFFDGIFCMGNPTQRLEFAFFNSAGELHSVGSIASQGGVGAPGTTRFYQLWYRDPVGSPCGTGANLTNGVRVDWL